jgi:hypothetical protein
MPKPCRYCGRKLGHHKRCTRPRYTPRLSIKAYALAEAIKFTLKTMAPEIREITFRNPDNSDSKGRSKHSFNVYFDNAYWLVSLRRLCIFKSPVNSKT